MGSPYLVITPTELQMIRDMLNGRRVNDSPEGPELAWVRKRLREKGHTEYFLRCGMNEEELHEELEIEKKMGRLLSIPGINEKFNEERIRETEQLLVLKSKEKERGGNCG